MEDRQNISYKLSNMCLLIVKDVTGPLQIWCAAGVNLTGGKTRDGGSIVGASVFYSDLPASQNKAIKAGDDVEKLDQELKVTINNVCWS